MNERAYKSLLRHMRKLEKKVRKYEGGGKKMNAIEDLVRVNAKFIVALIAGAIVLGLKHFGFIPNQEFIDALGVVVGAILVWLVPNKK